MYGFRRGGRLTAMTASAVALALLGAPAATAAAQDEDLWYFTETGIADVQKTAKGEGVTIALFDTGVSPTAPALQGADIVGTEFTCEDGSGTVQGLHDDIEAQHGTDMAAILVGSGEPVNGQPGVPGIVPDATLISYDVMGEDETTADVFERSTCETSGALQRDSILDAVERGADLIVTAVGFSLEADAVTALIHAMNEGVVVVAANPNAGGAGALESSVGSIYIHHFNGAVSVENATRSGAREDPVVGPWISILAPGTGYVFYDRGDGGWNERSYSSAANSPASMYVGGVMALLKSAYPEATGAQLIQALVRGADGGNSDLVRTDEKGYGFISPRTMLATDPTTYPDENPLLVDEPDRWPLPTDFADGVFTDDTWDYPLGEEPAPMGSGGTAEPSAPTADAPADEGPAIVPLLIGAAIVGGLVVIGGAVVLIVLLTRRRTSG